MRKIIEAIGSIIAVGIAAAFIWLVRLGEIVGLDSHTCLVGVDEVDDLLGTALRPRCKAGRHD